MKNTSKLNLVELIFIQSSLENSIERLGDFVSPLTPALEKIKQQKRAALTKEWDKRNL